MGKKSVAAWFFLLLSLGACAQLPAGEVNLPTQHERHLKGGSSVADVAETPDEHVKERTEDVGHHQ